MSGTSLIRTDILPEGLLEVPQQVRVIAETQFTTTLAHAVQVGKSTSPMPAKEITEVIELIGQVIADYERKNKVIADARVVFTYENPDVEA